jgi:excisionase family DNA binding protein
MLLRLHVNTIKYMIRNGKLPATKVGRAWRIPRDAVLAVRSGEASGNALRAVVLDLLSALSPFAKLHASDARDELQYFIPGEWIRQARATVKRAEALGLHDDTPERKTE